MLFRITKTALLMLPLAAAPALADGHCPDFGFSSEYLNEFFCDQLDTLTDPANEPPTRTVVVPDAETQAIIDQFGLVEEAFQADPRSTLDLLARIRSAGGTTSE